MAINRQSTGKELEKELINWVMDCKREADDAKQTRMDLNECNFRTFQLDHDFSHKVAGQSREVLAKQRMAVEQITSFFQQAIADTGEWFKVIPSNYSLPEDAMLLRPHEIMKIMSRQLEYAKYFSHIGKCIHSGLLGGLIIEKISGKLVPKSKYKVVGKKGAKKIELIEDHTWQLDLGVVRQEDYYPDPTGACLYEIEEMYVDLHVVKQLSKGKKAIYNESAVNSLSTSFNDENFDQYKRNNETIQDHAGKGHRPRVKLTEFIGDVVDTDGNIAYKNVFITVANDTTLIRGPVENFNWTQKSNYVIAALMEQANTVWPIALMDAPTKHSHTLTEFLNLTLDAAFKQVHAISQIRTNDLQDPSQVSNGIPAGTALLVKNSLPHGAKVLEPLTTVDIPSDAITVYNLLNQEFNAAALTNDLRQGVMPFRQVKATEVVEASQTITSVFQGLAKNVESLLIEEGLNRMWPHIAQHFDLIDEEEFVAMFGEKRGKEIAALDPQDVFAQTVSGYRFQVFGISRILSRSQNFQKYTTFLQIVGGSDVLLEEFIKKYDFGKLLGEILTTLNLDKDKLELSEADKSLNQGGGPLSSGGPGIGPNSMSQVGAPQPDQGLAALFAQGPAAPPIPGGQ